MTNRAMLIILAGVRPEHEADFNLWYDREHLPDRMTVPGFLNARRYEAEGSARWPYLALYEARDIDAFRSPEYRERLANQSDWSKRVLPTFVEPQRSIARRVAQVGMGIGSATFLATVRPDAGGEDRFLAGFTERATTAMDRDPNIVAVGLYAGDPELSRPVAEYPPVSGSPVRGDDWFLFVDTIGPVGGEAVLDALTGSRGDAGHVIGTYRFRSAVAATDAETP
jgi:hypothetical protein